MYTHTVYIYIYTSYCVIVYYVYIALLREVQGHNDTINSGTNDETNTNYTTCNTIRKNTTMILHC